MICRTSSVAAGALVVLAAALTVTLWSEDAAAASHGVLAVDPGESIQAAVDAARPGDRVTVRPGSYHEIVTISTDGITLEGSGATLMPPAAPPPNCFGTPSVAFGICVAGKVDPNSGVTDPVEDVRILGLTITGFDSSGIIVNRGEDTRISRTRSTHNGTYGYLSVRSTGTYLSDNWTTGNDESGYYVGVSPDAHATLVRNVSVDDGVLGIFIRNSSHGVIKGNVVTGNCVGIGLFDIPGGAPPPQTSDWDVRHNDVRDNTRFCVDDPPLSGIGILLSGVLDSAVRHNDVTGNRPALGEDSPLAGGIVAAPAGLFGSRPSANDLIAHNTLRDNAPFDLVRFPDAGENIEFEHNRCATSSPAGAC